MMNNESTEIIRSHINKLSGSNISGRQFVFGMHKGGSTMLSDFFELYLNGCKINSVPLSGLLFNKGVSDEQYSNDSSILTELKSGYIFYGFRYLPNFMNASKGEFVNDRSIILVRDPRDCVVSAYFSFLKSHVISTDLDSEAAKNILAERSKYEQADIDTYCLNEINRFTSEICGYAHFMHENCKISRYEDIIFNKEKFFKSCLEFLGLEFNPVIFERALKHVDIVPNKEDESRHIRGVQPGDHLRKLKVETIEKINLQYKDLLELFNYC